MVCRHLPVDIRVFSVQRVTNSYNCRSMCVSRAYEYHIPAAVLGLRVPAGGADGGGDAVADAAHNEDVMKRLRAALACLVGERPFHNYTKRYEAVRRTPGGVPPAPSSWCVRWPVRWGAAIAFASGLTLPPSRDRGGAPLAAVLQASLAALPVGDRGC